MLLTRDEIIKELHSGNIKITPTLQDSQISVASVDLRLGNHFRVFLPIADSLPVTEDTDYKKYTKEVMREKFLLAPNTTVLGVTVEKISLPGNIAAWIEGRSRFARLGLLIHISAGLIQPGVNNHQVLEITNLGPNVLELYAGERICQLVFQRVEGSAIYKGKFKEQTKP